MSKRSRASASASSTPSGVVIDLTVDCDSPKSKRTVTTTTTTTETETQTPDLLSGCVKQGECAICMESIAACTTLPQCGCNFCFCCVDECRTWDSIKCPLCSKLSSFRSLKLNKGFDNYTRAILSVVESASLPAWEQRVAAGIVSYKMHFAPPPPLVFPEIPRGLAAHNLPRVNANAVPRGNAVRRAPSSPPYAPTAPAPRS